MFVSAIRQPITWLAAAAVVLGSPSMASAAYSSLGRPYYDARLHALVLPYSGSVPAFSQSFADDTRIAYDFHATLPGYAGSEKSWIAHSPLLKRWALAWRGPGTVRLALGFKASAGVSPRVDVAHRRLIFVILPGLAATPAAPHPGVKPRPTPHPAFELPVEPTPEATPEPSSPQARITPMPVITPQATSPEPTATPATPVPTPYVVPTPEAPISTETPAPITVPGVPTNETSQVPMGFAFGLSTYDENHPTGNVVVTTNNVPSLGLSVGSLNRPGLGNSDWHAVFDLQTASYVFQDRDLPLSLHFREDWQSNLTAAYRFDLAGVQLFAGPGLMLRFESALHSGSPPTPIEAFSSFRLFTGPEIVGAVRWPIPWLPDFLNTRVSLDAAIAPYVYSTLDANVAPLPYVFGHRVELDLEHEAGGITWGLGYRRFGLNGSGYEETFQGPVFTLKTALPDPKY